MGGKGKGEWCGLSEGVEGESVWRGYVEGGPWGGCCVEGEMVVHYIFHIPILTLCHHCKKKLYVYSCINMTQSFRYPTTTTRKTNK